MFHIFMLKRYVSTFQGKQEELKDMREDFQEEHRPQAILVKRIRVGIEELLVH